MNRGGSRRVVYTGRDDRELFLRVLGEAHATYALEVHAYCLMSNHYHLLARTPRGNLAQAMRHLDGVYTQRLNRRHDLDGSLFRGRYHAILIDADDYLLAVSRYIHLNPVSAKLVASPDDFAWSSFGAYAGLAPAPPWLHVAAVLECLGPPDSRRRYRRFVARGVEPALEDFYARDTPGPVLGSRAFIDSLAADGSPDPEVPQRRSLQSLPSMDEVLAVVACVFAVPVETILRGGRRNDARSVAVALCRRPGGHALRSVAARFGLGHYSGVTIACRRLEQRMQRDRALAIRYETARARVLDKVSSVKT